MIFVEAIGGLGNQMFQYALYLKLKKRNGSDNVKLHVGYFKEIKDNNGYELNRVFSINDGEDYTPVVASMIDDKTSLLSIVRRKIFGYRRSYVTEGNDLSFNECILSLNSHDNIYLRGSWQSEKYFKDIRQELLDVFEFKQIEDEKNSLLVNKIINNNSVSVHIRRGDYINNPVYNEMLGGVCDVEYYYKAIANIHDVLDNPYYFIFSDDINWVKENLEIFNKFKVEYIDSNKGLNSYLDMQLMSLCKNNIIANSTFSWWAAWLNQNDDKIVIAPKTWFKGKKVNRDITPESWVKI